MKLFILRHCERNIKDNSFESPLTDKGHINAEYLSEIINYHNITKVYSSPFLRAIQTGSYFSKKYKKKINIDYSLCEFEFEEEKKIKSLNNFIVYNDWLEKYDLNMENMILDKFIEDESIDICMKRVYNFLNYLENEYNNKDENILIISHQSIVNLIICIINKTYKNLEDLDKYYPMGLMIQLI